MQKQQLAITCLSALIFLTSSGLVEGQASCPRISPLNTFDTKSFTGTWWMYAVSPASGPVTNSPCQHVQYTYVSNNVLKVTEFGVNGSPTPDSGTVTQVQPGQFKVRLARLNGIREYDILDIDYTSYFVVYNCQVLAGATVETRIIYTRSPNPSQSVISKALEKKGLSLKDFKLTDLKKCK